jgi:prevent-host-death family protein
MAKTVSAAEATSDFDDVMQWVAREGTAIVVEREGAPYVAVVPIQEYDRWSEPPPEDWETLVEAARAEIRAHLGGRTLPPADETIREMREERDAQLLDLS